MHLLNQHTMASHLIVYTLQHDDSLILIFSKLHVGQVYKFIPENKFCWYIVFKKSLTLSNKKNNENAVFE